MRVSALSLGLLLASLLSTLPAAEPLVPGAIVFEDVTEKAGLKEPLTDQSPQ